MKARVLIVDDEQGLRDTFRLFLSRAGHEVTVAECLEEGRRALEEWKFDVAVVDLVMPDGSGLELLRLLRRRLSRTKVLIVTGHPSVDTAAESVRHGAFDYLSKPVSREDLCAAVHNAAEFKRREEDSENYRRTLEHLVDQRTEHLRRILEQTVFALGSALEIRDPYTAGHQRRVTELSLAIGNRLGLSEEQLEGLRIAGLLHDIGKLRIPAEILAKPTRLSKVEFDIIKTHSAAGHEIVHRIEFPWPVADIVRQHHERLDGSGYPDGIAGEKILLEARVLAVADVVEAMATHRPYRPALGIELALEALRKDRGVAFDAEVVDACIHLFQEAEFGWEDREVLP